MKHNNRVKVSPMREDFSSKAGAIEVRLGRNENAARRRADAPRAKRLS
jgi:hypothetical protein